jgi:nicotinate dehydrogenase subunit B
VNRIVAKWDIPGATYNHQTVYDHFLKVGTDRRVAHEKGDLSLGRSESETVVETEFRDPYVAHAPIETHTATAVMEGDTMVIWGSTQTPFGCQEQVARALDLPLEKVHMKEILLGGGFGGKSASAQVVEAARLAKHSGSRYNWPGPGGRSFFTIPSTPHP